MSRYIDADELILKSKCHKDCSTCDFARDGDTWCDGELYVVQVLQQPTVDLTSVVRCKDCKFNRSDRKCLHPKSIIDIPGDDDFCSYGERKGK